jgi:penicillin-binding protein 1A
MTNLNLCGLNNDLKLCLEVVDKSPLLPHRFVTTLVAAEDHRSLMHPGVDPIAMLRVLLVLVKTRRFQGASTIEQQLVRVVLGRYERTLRRKFREQLIAIALCCKRPKARIAMAYLSHAFYGSRRYGLSELTRACGPDLEAAGQDSVSHLVARLKYPEPLHPSAEWRRKILNRVQYIGNRLPESANSGLQPTQNAVGVLRG